MGRFQSCKGVVERALRRAFYDGVLELYEGSGTRDRVICVALEGSLSLTINQTETLVIRLNEKAQRADETVEDVPESNSAASDDGRQESVSRPKKRKSDNQSVFPDRVVVKKEVKEEKVDYEFERLVPLSYSATAREPRDSARVDPSPELSTDPGQDTGCDPSRDASNDPSSDANHFNSEDDQLPHDLSVSSEWYDQTARGDRESASGSCGQNLQSEQTSKQPDRLSQVSEAQGVTSERQTCIRRGSQLPHPSQTQTTASVKQEPEPIVIEDEEDDHDDHRSQNSPYWLSWHQAARQQMEEKMLPVTMWAAPCDCPVCGEVLHSRHRLASHLDKHRHTFRTTCQVCRTDSLTLDALHLHLRAVHAPRLIPLSATVTADTLMGQAMLPYRQGSMSAIASLVSMAGCPLGASGVTALDSAFVTGGHTAGLGGGASSRVSEVMEQILSYQSQLTSCSICKLLFSSKQDLAAHLTSLHGIQTSTGSEATAGSSRERKQRDGGGTVLINDQQEEVDLTASTAYTCFDCSMGFTSLNAYTQHCIMQHGSPTVPSQGSCSVCHKAFDTWKALRSHYYSAHRVIIFCDKCKLGFTSNEEMKVHYEATHGSDTPSMSFVCDICNKGFYSQSQCSAHKRSHISEKSFACQVCGSAFFKRGDLSKHFRTVHAPNRVFACILCGKRGTRMDNMRSHVKSHGKHMTRDEILAMIEEVKT